LGYIKRRHTRVSVRTHEGMIKVKYGVLAVVLFISVTLAISLVVGVGKSYESAMGVFAPAPFNALSPVDTLFSILPRMVLTVVYTPEVLIAGVLTDPLLWVRLAIMIATMVLAVYVSRSWCRYLCPIGATLAVLSRFSFLGLKRDPLRCTRAGCRTCVDACPMMIRILELPWENFTDSECIYCLKCVDACPTKALKPRFA
ncbi:4Fe-4S binding protein, partial [Candidatus Bathyarchaeota archaeon]|nr:4Fe-4S binding protein [Candidatus Bathyarchaeota archaeon]